jgi:hypothetical protein
MSAANSFSQLLRQRVAELIARPKSVAKRRRLTLGVKAAEGHAAAAEQAAPNTSPAMS